jgi:hypothetical protein
MAEYYVSVDIEADGPIPGEYSMLSIGAAVRWRPDTVIATFYRELQPISTNFVQEALDVCKLDRSHLAMFGMEPADAMAQLEGWLASFPPGRRVFVGFNATFDWSFVNWYFHKYLQRNPFGISGLDIKAYYMGKFGTTWGDTAKARLPKELRPKLRHTHNARDDAEEQLLIWEAIRNAIL